MAIANIPNLAIQKLTEQSLSTVSESAALARPLADLIADTLAAAGRSANTVRAYQTGIGYFLQYLDTQRGDLLPAELQSWRPFAIQTELSRTDKRGRSYTHTSWEYRGCAAILRLVDAALVDGFRNSRELAGDNPNAASLRVYAAKTFLAVALRDNVLTSQQGLALGIQPYKQRQKKDEKPTGRRLSATEVRALRSALHPGTNKGKRDLAIIDLALFAGLRCEEIATISAEDFTQDGGRFWIILEGKGSKTRRVKVHDTLYKSIIAWVNATGKQLGEGGCLFTGVNKGDRITRECVNAGVVNRLVAEYGAIANLAPANGSNRLAPHDLRRTFARNAYDNGASLLAIKDQLGHSDPENNRPLYRRL